ncbi:hypothetical protein [Ensifer adhaerens]|uniref:hypothetical protein n=1 Tax=Ensifer adhaerens TaxID=106592 RepID=UPI00098FE263|nr:hypothetical protein [Ensifer adhaerens]
MTEGTQRQMHASEIPAFVADVIETGCEICAVGHDSYVIGEVEEQAHAKKKLDRIGEKYGNRDALRLQIVAYLWSIGRFVDVGGLGTRH